MSKYQLSIKKPLIKGDSVSVKGSTYGYFQFVELLPKGSHDRKCVLAKVLHSTNDDFSFAFEKVFCLVDLKKL
tara:strand:- start:279 stop:497 length:219 start_codon:yes stop_codon:yes gene_type:complete